MFNKKNRIVLSYKIYLIFLLSFFSLITACKSLPINDGVSPEKPVIVEEKISFEDFDQPYKYIFIRLYNPDYINPFYIANLLQFGINITNVYPQIVVSHASFNFDLSDNYWGLTQTGRPQLDRESCLDTAANEYMEKCDPATSQQITYAIRVNEEEYKNAQEFVEEYAEQEEIRYKTSLNFKLAAFNIRRKFFTPKEKQLFGSINYEPSTREERLEFDPAYTENDFVCSTFLAYVLNKNVASVNQYFNENQINYRYVNVSDIPKIPGIVKLFSTTWDSYMEGAKAFVTKYPEFSEYFPE